MSGAYGTSVHISRSNDLIVLGVNTTPNDHGGAKISGAMLDMFAASITGTVPTPTPTPTPTPAPTPAPTSGLGRIAISSDGNDHDCDDITATAMSLALLAKTGNASRWFTTGTRITSGQRELMARAMAAIAKRR